MSLASQIRRRRTKIKWKPKTPRTPSRLQDRSEPVEKLFSVAIKRGDRVWDGGRGGHAKLRRSLDPDCPDPYNTVPGDIDGFIVAPSGRFVDREEAKTIGMRAGQVTMDMGRELLSSDIDW